MMWRIDGIPATKTWPECPAGIEQIIFVLLTRRDVTGERIGGAISR